MLPGMNQDLTINWDFFILLFFVSMAIAFLISFGYCMYLWIGRIVYVKKLEKRHKWIRERIKNL